MYVARLPSVEGERKSDIDLYVHTPTNLSLVTQRSLKLVMSAISIGYLMFLSFYSCRKGSSVEVRRLREAVVEK